MATPTSPSIKRSLFSNHEALAIAAQAKVLSGSKLEQLVVRLQRHTGQKKEACWRFVIQYGLKGSLDHRRWTEEEFEMLREGLAKFPLEEMAAKLHRTPKAVRGKLGREGFNLREIKCDCFSLVALARALHVRRAEVRSWIEQGWLQATVTKRGNRHVYSVTPEALAALCKHHLHDLLKRRIPNQTLFEAYVQYCFSPKHTAGEQLLDVRRDKREREAFAALQSGAACAQPGAEDDDDTFDA
jgi:hypothetical protein